MTEEERKRFKEKLFVIAHEFNELKNWEIELLKDLEYEDNPTKLEIDIVDRLYTGEL